MNNLVLDTIRPSKNYWAVTIAAILLVIFAVILCVGAANFSTINFLLTFGIASVHPHFATFWWWLFTVVVYSYPIMFILALVFAFRKYRKGTGGGSIAYALLPIINLIVLVAAWCVMVDSLKG